MALESGHTLLSHADYVNLPDEPRGEVLEGVFVVTPAPTSGHQHLVLEIGFALKAWLRAHPEAGQAFVAPLDVILRAERPAVILQPDVLFVSAARAAIVQDWIRGAPDLVVEIVSPTSASRDAITKHEVYARYGVREYWLVWPAERRVDVFVADAEGAFGPSRTLDAHDELRSEQLPGFSLPLADLWHSVAPTDETGA